MRFIVRGSRLFVVLGLVVLAQIGCSHAPQGQDPVVEDPIVPDQIARLELADELAGRSVAHRVEGAWNYRSTAGGGAGDGARVETASRSVAVGGRGGGGAAPPPGAPAPRKPAPPSASSAPAEGREPLRRADKYDTGDWSGDDGGPADSPVADSLEETEADFAETKDAARGEASEKSRLRLGHGGQARALKAGSTDDNEAYDEYLAFLDHWAAQKGIQSLYQPLDVRDRKFVRVVDVDGRPVPGARVAIVDEMADRMMLDGTTYGDGRVPFYPHVLSASAGDEIGDSSHYHVEARVGDQRVRMRWDGSGDELELRLDETVAAPEPLALDVVLLIDTTGSMGDEIASIKAALLRMTEQLRSLDREFDLRYGAVLYRDIGDSYLTAKHPFTSDVEAFDEALKSVQAQGGGDGPESLNQGLAEAVGGVEWRSDAAKLVFLIADAPPHMDYPDDVWYGESLRAAVGRGVKIHSVAASGLDPRGTLVFRQIAQYTRGKFIFIEYGGHAASKASHGVTGASKSNNLEDILFEQISDELAHWGRE